MKVHTIAIVSCVAAIAVYHAGLTPSGGISNIEAPAHVHNAAHPEVPMPGNAFAEVETRYYRISGASIDELIQQMQQKGPNGYWAYTKWRIRWTGGCYVKLTVTYTYPEWDNRASASPQLQARWDRMIANLRHHELGHGLNGRKAAAEIADSSCRDNPRGIISKWAAQDRSYDARTGHGRSQGATL
jgi:hypothetical protein